MLGGIQGRQTRLWRVVAVFAATGAMALSGCSSSSESPSDEGSPTAVAPAEKVDAIANTVPESIKSTGTLVVGVNVPYAPNEFKDPEGKLVGFDVDLMNAIAGTLGLTPEYKEADFAKIIPSIQGGTFDVGMSSFTDSKEREEQVDFVTYFSAGTAWAQPAGGDINPEDACGKKVAVQATTVQETDELPARSKKCVDEGKPAIEIIPFDSQDAATNAVVLGQADAMSADSPVTLYAIKQTNGKLEQAGETFDSAPYGWPVEKGSPLAQSLLQALQHLIDNGKYQEIAANWGLEEGMIDKPVINGAIS
ncbi:ABC transporter substrate-binding protein [Mycolicibacterium gilvum]|uniref:Amino acid ABC transporter substrate-binding protein, PAAT family n=4 Tax=Mycobacteriaceae TaxID=1762 RepID=E6TAG5_MYCSR|nr:MULTISPECIES: ABC transporter substrate-binding protein [Mycolicibacterium]ABP46057.1 amino acid ABC transporter substrate-binding protein, PAAT family [Mycolicibacterium gilvum PYR-GCK]ADT99546.1 amino acid ABC transporter substrate-binding protein, PAAT family [Mycolicibacterium gilvum Spyr1]MBV5245909.1 ABC transporter substrate-binding protein [Mycolicibacterium sp. PAM1]MCV7057309.1 ABC transporter substrate-binding protein [Mycolicibacterium gilvum]STZ43512.1 extracellular solute-bind